MTHRSLLHSRGLHLMGVLAATGMITMALSDIAGARSSDPSLLRPLESLGPKHELSVYWVGHSLVESKATSEWGEHSLMTLVGRFAASRGLGYRMGDHTLWGSALSALWRGRPHSYTRDASEMIAKREAFEQTADQYDTLVLTEGLPLAPSLRVEYSAYYLRRFYCTLKQANPEARVYLYQSWLHLQGSSEYSNFPPPHKFDWRAEMIAQRKVWVALAETAARPGVRAPTWLHRLGVTTTSNGGCDLEAPIFIVPVGQAMLALDDALAKPPTADDGFNWPDGTRLKTADLFLNPYIDWPADWPIQSDENDIDPTAALAKLSLRDPAKKHDDIHPSAVGIYFTALVQFATLYRQTPVGLPAPASIGDGLARALQCIAWKTVLSDPLAGVAGEAQC